MSCASCVNRIERYLRKTPGVAEANVNLATEVATVRYLPEVAGLDEIARAIEAAGYEIRHLPEPKAGAGGRANLLDEADAEAAVRAREQRTLGLTAAASLAVAALAMLIMYLPNAPWTMEQAAWLLIGPATAVQFLAGRRFYRAALRAARHGATSMDTLVVVGTSAAWAFSVLVTVAPGLLRSAGIEPQTYFDSSTAIIGLILTGRWLEARAKGQTVGAIKALHRAAGSVRPNRPRRAPRWTCRSKKCASATSCACDRANASRWTAGSSTAPPRSTSRCSPASRSRPRRVPAPR